MANAVNWFEIPASNYDRAINFYQEVLGAKFEEFNKNGTKMAFFNYDPQSYGASGAIAFGQGYEPSEKGSIVYLNAGEDLSAPLGKVEEAGGKIVMGKTSIGENGFIAHFIDTEGNRVALHSMN